MCCRRLSVALDGGVQSQAAKHAVEALQYLAFQVFHPYSLTDKAILSHLQLDTAGGCQMHWMVGCKV